MENEFQRRQDDEQRKPGVVIIRKKRIVAHRKRLLTLVLMLLFTGIMLGTSTYAWFTSNKTVTVSEITVNVSTATGLQISADGLNFKTILANADLLNAITTYAGAVNQIPQGSASMSPVSTIGEVDSNTGFMKMYLGDLKADDDTTYNCNEEFGFCLIASQADEENRQTGNYIAFDIFLKLQAEAATQLYMNLDASKVVPSDTDTGIQNASRIAFLIEGNVEDGTALATIQGLKGATSHGATGSTTYIWEPNYDTHTATGVRNATQVYAGLGASPAVATSYTSTHGTTAFDSSNKSALLPYWGVKANISAENSQKRYETTADYFAQVTPDYTTTYGQSGQQQIFTIEPGITKIRVYMWVEGQDVDCEDAASGGNIEYNLQFTTEAA